MRLQVKVLPTDGYFKSHLMNHGKQTFTADDDPRSIFTIGSQDRNHHSKMKFRKPISDAIVSKIAGGASSSSQTTSEEPSWLFAFRDSLALTKLAGSQSTLS